MSEKAVTTDTRNKDTGEAGTHTGQRTTGGAVFITPFSHGEAVLYSTAPSPDDPPPPLSAPFDAQGNAAAITGLESVWATDGHKSVRTESSATTAISRSAGGRKDLRRDLFWIQCSLKKHGLAA